MNLSIYKFMWVLDQAQDHFKDKYTEFITIKLKTLDPVLFGFPKYF